MNIEQKDQAKFWINVLMQYSPTEANSAAISLGPLLWDNRQEYGEFKRSVGLEAYRKGIGR